MPYFSAVQLGTGSTISLTTSAEQDLIILNDPKALQKGFLTIFYNVALLSATEADFRYYAAYVVKSSYSSTDWFQMPGKTSATISAITDGFLQVKSTLSFVDTLGSAINNNPMPAAAAFKVTGKSIGASSGTVSVVVFGRDN